MFFPPLPRSYIFDFLCGFFFVLISFAFPSPPLRRSSPPQSHLALDFIHSLCRCLGCVRSFLYARCSRRRCTWERGTTTARPRARRTQTETQSLRKIYTWRWLMRVARPSRVGPSRRCRHFRRTSRRRRRRRIIGRTLLKPFVFFHFFFFL